MELRITYWNSVTRSAIVIVWKKSSILQMTLCNNYLRVKRKLYWSRIPSGVSDNNRKFDNVHYATVKPVKLGCILGSFLFFGSAMLCLLGFFLVVISGTSLKILSKNHCKTFFSCYRCIFTWISTMELLVEMNINAATKNEKQLTYLFLWNFHLTRWHLWWVEFFNEVNFDWPGCITSCVLVSERWKFHLPSQKQVWKQTSLHPYMVYLSRVISADVWSPTVRKTLYLKANDSTMVNI